MVGTGYYTLQLAGLWISFPAWGCSRTGPKALFWGPKSGWTVHWISWSDGALVLLADRESPVLCSLFMCHCGQGCGVGYVASPVFWLGPLVRWAEGHVQQWMELWVSFPSQAGPHIVPKAGKALVCRSIWYLLLFQFLLVLTTCLRSFLVLSVVTICISDAYHTIRFFFLRCSVEYKW